MSVKLDSLAQLLIDEGESLSRLYNIVHQAGYEVQFRDDKGVAISSDGNVITLNPFNHKETQSHSIAAQRSDDMHGREVGITDQCSRCLTETIFNAEGRCTGYLEVSSANGDLAEGSIAITRAVMQATARAIEERSFRNRHRGEWIIALIPTDQAGCGILLAVDENQRLVGADRHARSWLSDINIDLDKSPSLWRMFDRNHALFRNRDLGDISTSLSRLNTAEKWIALVTSPILRFTHRHNSQYEILHLRPRLGTIGQFGVTASPSPACGGLTARVFQRVCEYIDSHLSNNIELGDLARIAGLSKSHFTRAFKESSGTAPHQYLILKRVERARQLVAETDQCLSQIALESGFADQSHFTRCFRQYVGTTPSSFRRSMR